MNIEHTIKEVFNIEISSLNKIRQNISIDFVDAVKTMAATKGKLVITGMGKSGHVGKKIAATLSSTGTASIFMHPAEAIHGDLGLVERDDAVLAISYSGETEEILKLIPSFNRLNVPLISITGNINSTLAINSKHIINIQVEKEACPLALAPTSSTTAALVVGDAIAVSLMKLKNFEAADFAVFHPGGALGRKLLSRVCDEMINDNLPTVVVETSFKEVVISISKGMLGLTIVLDNGKDIVGMITDGDLRRAMQKHHENIFQLRAIDIMTLNPIKIASQKRICEAEEYMMAQNINSLLVADNDKLIGVLLQRKIKY